MAEYTTAREVRVHKVSPNVTFEEAALAEPLAVAYTALIVEASGSNAAIR